MRFRLIRSDQQFFDFFDAAIDNLSAATSKLLEITQPDVDIEPIRSAIEDLEHAGDRVLADTLNRLNSSFVTPIDREDITRLITVIDDVVDSVHHIAELIAIFGVPTVDQFSSLAKQLNQATDAAVECVRALRTFKDVHSCSQRIHELESQADGIYRQALGHLFDGSFSAIEIMKNRDVIEAIEQAIDGIEDIGDLCESIYIKHT